MKKLVAASSVALATAAVGLTGTGAHAAVPATGATSRCLANAAAKLTLNGRGVPTRASRAAHQVQAAARHCDSRALIKLATIDRTRVSFGSQTPAQVFKLPQTADRPYDYLLRALSTRPGAQRAGNRVNYVWPRVAAGSNSKSRAAWQEAVRAGLITQKQADRAWNTDKSYYGYRLTVSAAGNWDAFVAGD